MSLRYEYKKNGEKRKRSFEEIMFILLIFSVIVVFPITAITLLFTYSSFI